MRMFDALMRRAERAAAGRVEATLERLAVVVRDAGGISVERRGGGLVLSGRQLVQRWLGEGELRFAPWRRG